MDRKTLLDIRGDTKSRLIALQVSKIDEGQKDEYANVITSLENEIAGIDTKLGELAKTDAGKASLDTTLSDEVTSEYQLSRILAGIRLRVDAVGVYKPTQPIHTWLEKLSNIYKMLVKPNLQNHLTLEGEFCSTIILSLPLAGQTKFADKTTWETLKQGLKSNYSSDISVFQHLSKVWSCNLSGVRWNDLSNKLTSVLTESKTSIMSKYTKDSKTLDADAVFSLIGAMLMSEAVRNNSPETYRLMLEALDSCRNADEVAKKAAFYSDRLQGLESQVFRVNRTTVEPQKRSKPKKAESGKDEKPSEKDPKKRALIKKCIQEKKCIKFNLGEECNAESCKYKHAKVSSDKDDAYQSHVAEMNRIFEDWSSDPFPQGN